MHLTAKKPIKTRTATGAQILAPGETHDFDEKDAKRLIAKGYATEAKDPNAMTPEAFAAQEAAKEAQIKKAEEEAAKKAAADKKPAAKTGA